ncbi:NAD(P)/FAD-dependent oxidoreductase [Flavobacterium arcticum]|uniref:NAD(P)/FAD-dependent oxidoreductase n=1 Tax=Flavobacterium arcticum TaxID=1784713 RepID=A0A345HEK2_9FLAO|nr:NAD(P)/FAD-dependent oxidoreductase [Flavobacterium arcticum]AXG75012.1 NAD(P)/FAD-dependent oxidoreductase [Flavobacterium arcticum]KAF2506565.1 NAD(P)/FAD-dependent oxidoreductase [Flavobacterium arcticum]
MENKYEVIIVGGSYAGLSAAMALGRASRKTLIIDSGKPCNRKTPHSHNFITHDGETPAAIAKKAKDQVLKYPTVQFVNDKAIDVKRIENGFIITTENNNAYQSKKILFATGVYDIMPNIDGFSECWGISVIHCPYCHGYEVKGQKTAILANGDVAYHYSMLLQQWTKDMTILTNGKAEFNDEQLTKLKNNNISIIESTVAQLIHKQGQLECVVFSDGTSHNFPVMYARPEFKQHCDITEKMNLLNDTGFINVDEMHHTGAEGLYAAGDCTTPMRSVATAVASGMKAGAVINNDMALETF